MGTDDIQTEYTDPAEAVVVNEKLVSARDVDVALTFLRSRAPEADDVQINERKLMRKVDRMNMPLMLACYYLQYTDKTLLNYSGIMGIIEDTHMPPNGYSYLSMIFYISFLFFEPLQGYMMQKFPTAKWLGGNVVLWGLVVTLNCACKSYAPVVALRVLLGCLEASVAPSLILLTGMWYKRPEQVVRMGVWYQGTSFGPMVSSLVAYGLLHYTDANPGAYFKSWQILFLIFGLLTIATGILVILFLPDSPMTAKQLTDQEKIFVLERIRENQTGVENKRFKKKQVLEVVGDYRTWLLLMIVVATSVPNGAVSSFQSIIIQNIGYSDYETLLLNLPGAGIGFVTVFGCSWWAGHFNQRGVAITAMVVPTLIGGALMAWLSPDMKGGLLAGMFLTTTVGSSLPLMYSWITSNYGGHTKKVVMNVLVLMAFCVGNIIGPLTFRETDAPDYIPAKMCIVIVLAFAILVTATLDFVYWRENRVREREKAAGRQAELPEDHEFLDLTDKENRNFRYLL